MREDTDQQTMLTFLLSDYFHGLFLGYKEAGVDGHFGKSVLFYS